MPPLSLCEWKRYCGVAFRVTDNRPLSPVSISTDLLRGITSKLNEQRVRTHKLDKALAARDRANAEGRGGMPPKAPQKGAKGIAGLRADLEDGSLAVFQLEAMPVRELGRRYGIRPETASKMKRGELRRLANK